MTARIVIDLGFGDAGKGLTVDHLAGLAPRSSLVVRFSGGHQVGHTVVRRGRRHTFSNFGAGTLAGVPTFYSANTTVFPPAALMEAEVLSAGDEPVQPVVHVDPMTMITTPFDVAWNRVTERVNGHGSCGVGFGATVERNLEGLALPAIDLANRWMTEQRLTLIDDWYRRRAVARNLESAYCAETATIDRSAFIDNCCRWLESVALTRFDQRPPDRPDLIFEGSQGIMLDQIHGVFPHVTRSDTTSLGALELLRSIGWSAPVDIHYVTRCYQTRHGNGPMSSTDPVTLVNNEREANVHNMFQGGFRTARLDVGLLNHALRVDAAHHGGFTVRRHLTVTCLDQLPDFDLDSMLDELDGSFASVSASHGPSSTDVVAVTRRAPVLVR